MTPAPTRYSPRKVRLDVETIVAAGLEISSEIRSAPFTAKKLGARLGVDPSAVYRHFPSKGHLMEQLLYELNRRAVARVDAPPKDWKLQIRKLADSMLHEYTSHASIAAESMVLTTHGRGGLVLRLPKSLRLRQSVICRGSTARFSPTPERTNGHTQRVQPFMNEL